MAGSPRHPGRGHQPVQHPADHGQAEEAFVIAEDATARYPAVYGDQHPYYHGCAGNLALLRRERGDAAGARELDETSLARLDARLGRDHHYPLTVATNSPATWPSSVRPMPRGNWARIRCAGSATSSAMIIQ